MSHAVKNSRDSSRRNKLPNKVEARSPCFPVDNRGMCSRVEKSQTVRQLAAVALSSLPSEALGLQPPVAQRRRRRAGGREGRHSIERREEKRTRAASADNTGRRGCVCLRAREGARPNPGYGIEASLPAPVAALYCDFYISSRRGPARSKALCSMHAGGLGLPFVPGRARTFAG